MKSKAVMMKRLRAERKAKGLVKFEAYVTPETREKLKAMISKLED